MSHFDGHTKQKLIRSILRFSYLCISVIFLHCNSAPPQPTDVLVSPLDPMSPTFVKPQTTILSAPSTTEVLSVALATVTIRGNESAAMYSYKLDAAEWTAWSASTTIALSDLDEGSHLLTVRSRHRDNTTIEENPPSVRFTVNAVTGPAVMFSARRKDVLLGTNFNYYLVAEEVRNIYGAKAVFTYDNTAIRINSVTAGNIRNTTVQMLEQRYANTVRAEMFFTGNASMPGITGSDTVIVINCTGLRTGETAFSFVADSVQLRDTSNTIVTINQLVNGKVVVR